MQRVNMRNLSSSQIAAISRLFSSSVVCEFARRGRSSLFVELASEISSVASSYFDRTVADFYDGMFRILQRTQCRHEYVYKAALTREVLFKQHSLREASMVTEFRAGDRKADVVILNGTSTAYEIKSERDSLFRLEKQVNAYKNVFASVYVLAGANHIDEIRSTVGEDVGIWMLSERNRISKIRSAPNLPGRTSPSAIFDSIRNAEAKLILEKFGRRMPDVPNTELRATLANEFVRLTPEEAHSGMVSVLKKTRSLIPLEQLVGKLPASLHTAALSMPLRRGDHERLVSALKMPLINALT